MDLTVWLLTGSQDNMTMACLASLANTLIPAGIGQAVQGDKEEVHTSGV